MSTESLVQVTLDGMPLQQQDRVRRFLILFVEDMQSKDTTACDALLAALEAVHRKLNKAQKKKRTYEEATTQSLCPIKKSRGSGDSTQQKAKKPKKQNPTNADEASPSQSAKVGVSHKGKRDGNVIANRAERRRGAERET